MSDRFWRTLVRITKITGEGDVYAFVPGWSPVEDTLVLPRDVPLFTLYEGVCYHAEVTIGAEKELRFRNWESS